MHSEKYKRIIVRMPNWIGDAVMALPSLERLSSHFPSAEIYISAPEWSSDTYLFSDIKSKSILNMKRKKYLRNARLLSSVKADLIVFFTNSFSTALEGFLARIPERWGYATDGRKALLTSSLRPPLPSTLDHHAFYYLSLLDGLGVKGAISSPKLVARENTPPLLLKNGYNKDKPTLGINPGAAYGPAKRWLPERFQEVVKKYRSKNWQVILFGSCAETEISTQIQNNVDGVINLTGKTNLSEFISAIGLCNLFLTNDSGPMHLATALNVPTVAIFGPTDKNLTRPFGGTYEIVSADEPCSPCMKRTCPLKHHNCMQNISTQLVLEKLEEIETKVEP